MGFLHTYNSSKYCMIPAKWTDLRPCVRMCLLPGHNISVSHPSIRPSFFYHLIPTRAHGGAGSCPRWHWAEVAIKRFSSLFQSNYIPRIKSFRGWRPYIIILNASISPVEHVGTIQSQSEVNPCHFEVVKELNCKLRHVGPRGCIVWLDPE